MSILQSASEVLFWICAAPIVYAYGCYPVIIWCLARCFGRRAQAPAGPAGEWPSLSLLVVAHNEEAVIEDRIQNALAMDYPPERLEVVVASDGSSDGTTEVVRRFQGQGVRLLDYAERRGKAAVINAAMTELKGDIVLLSDANTRIDPAAARKLVRWFGDPAVGAVCGQVILIGSETGQNVDNLYWTYETYLKEHEARLGGLLGANGAIYALRRDLYVPVPDGTIVDDFVIPLLAKLRTGCRIVFDGEALAREEISPSLYAEFRRRARLGAGGYQSLRTLYPLLSPRRGWVAFTLFSHKVLRWLGPFFLIGMLGTSALLSDREPYRALLWGQLGFYGLSLLGLLLPGRLKVLRLLLLATLFTGLNVAFLVGFWRWLWGRHDGTWVPTPRSVEVPGVPP